MESSESAAGAAAATEKEKAPAKPTLYTILICLNGLDEESKDFRVITQVEAHGAPAARAAAFEKLAEEDQGRGAVLVAVPARSWDPKKRQLQSRSVES